jgi:hypothetical protein
LPPGTRLMRYDGVPLVSHEPRAGLNVALYTEQQVRALLAARDAEVGHFDQVWQAGYNAACSDMRRFLNRPTGVPNWDTPSNGDKDESHTDSDPSVGR